MTWTITFLATLLLPLTYAEWTSYPLTVRLIQVSVSGSRACGIDMSDKISCADNFGSFTRKDSKLSFKWISIDGNKAYAVSLDGERIYFTDNLNSRPDSWTSGVVPALRSLDLHGSYHCQVRTNRDVFCYGEIAGFKLNRRFDQVSIHGKSLCGLDKTNKDNSIICTTDFTLPSPKWIPLKASQYQSVSLSGLHVCGVSDSKVYCAKRISNGFKAFNSIGNILVKFRQVSVDNVNQKGIAYAITTTANVLYNNGF